MNSNLTENLSFKDEFFLRQAESCGSNVQNKILQKPLSGKFEPAELVDICLNNITLLQEQLLVEFRNRKFSL